MIEQNIEPTHKDFFNINRFRFEIESEKLRGILKKYNGWCHLKITKPEEKGTQQQNKAMHSLLTEYYKTGMHSSPNGYTLDQFKRYMKKLYGPLPLVIIEDNGEKEIERKSWADYSKHERRNFIDGLISEIHQSGAYNESERIRQIIDGMERDK